MAFVKHQMTEPKEAPAVHNVKIIRADRIYALEAADSVAEAMLVAGDEILHVGTLQECRDAARATYAFAPDRVDLPGRTVLPGFVDAHAHPVPMGQFSTWVYCGPDAVQSIDDIVAALRQRADEGVSVIRGGNYEHRNLVEQRHPTNLDLDRVATDREVYLLNASGHSVVVNSFALAKHGITRDTVAPEGGSIGRHPDGEPNGQIVDAACNLIVGETGEDVGRHGPSFHLGESANLLREYLGIAQQMLLSAGVTTAGDAQVSSRELSTYLAARSAGELRMRFSGYLLSHLLDEATTLGLTGRFGDDFFQIAGIKLYVDGSLGGWSAYFPEGYPGDPCRIGQLYHSAEEYESLLLQAHIAGLQTASHAQSPTAIGMSIDAIAKAQQALPGALRHRIEHCGLPTSEQVGLLAEHGITPVSQPQHQYSWGEGVVEAVGDAGERFNPLGEFAAVGIPFVLSSDAPVTPPNPLQAMQMAARRVTRAGNRLGGDSLKVSVRDAVAAHTINGARALGRDHEVGSLETGKKADFVVLSDDPFTVDVDDLDTVTVDETWVGGVRVFER